jgi:steroid delta-isomerase-like uncharacterized protein
MSAEENIAVVLRYIDEVSNGRNLETMDELLAPEFRDGWADAGIEGDMDRDGMGKLWQHLWSAFPDWHETVLDTIAGEDKVMVLLKSAGTHLGTYVGLPATGKSMEYTSVDLYRIADGRIVENTWVFDALTLLSQLGATPPFAELARMEERTP